MVELITTAHELGIDHLNDHVRSSGNPGSLVKHMNLLRDIQHDSTALRSLFRSMVHQVAPMVTIALPPNLRPGPRK
jgi:hypothetical protein